MLKKLFILKLSELLDSDTEYYETWELRGFEAKVPIFKVNDLKIWGATASVLSEFIELTKYINKSKHILHY